MADVAHVRLGNRLLEAIISANFHGAQYKIVFAIVRQTIGWQRQTVNASLPDLAALCSCACGGGFRRALRELIEEGVVVLAIDGGGATTNGYGLQHDYERWGKFSQAEAKLESIWGQRPEHSDQLPLQILTLHPDPAGSGGLSLQGQGACPSGVRGPVPTGSGSPGLNAGTAQSSERLKTLKDIEIPHTGKKLGRGEVMELLAAIEELRERSPGESKAEFIRLDKVRDRFGLDVARALKLIGGTKRLLTTKPEHRGILTSDFAAALSRARERSAQAVNE